MDFEKINEYLNLIPNNEVRKLWKVFRIFYEKVDFCEDDIEEYDFYENHYKELVVLKEMGIIDFWHEDDDIYFQTEISQKEMAIINNSFMDLLEDSGMNLIQL